MRMRVGDLEMDTSSNDISSNTVDSRQADQRRSDAAASTTPFDDVVTLSPLVFLFAALFGLAAAGLLVGLAVTQGAWLLLIPVPFLIRFVGYATVLAVRRDRPRKRTPVRTEQRAVLLGALESTDLTADELVERLGWSEAETLDALVQLVEEGEVVEDLDVDTGEWLYRRAVVMSTAPAREALPAKERLQTLQTTPVERRKH